ncbi:XisH family protein [Pseudanabaena yagii]|uniref:Fatty-acid oxidation protein subunit alpha n=1 Tax=Pseudanabaena yagii GIHE-NHR1 TaxID=2722753 RepID=A0ABX1LTS3_9CYAN|nr:XisH family protein [Pseudanabaena yagii]NMF59557.1 fatty-acid oxidation protein subunit alpha [Pseudanabaena yagii GIHE-NHR1]
MPAKDIFHNTVKIGLEKEGWEITHDPMYLDFGGVEIYIDLGAEKLIAAERKGEKIAVEVKSFISGSAISEFHKALGQFINYRTALSQKEPDRIMYLAVPNTIYETFFKLELIQIIIKIQNIKLIIYNPNREEIAQWIN